MVLVVRQHAAVIDERKGKRIGIVIGLSVAVLAEFFDLLHSRDIRDRENIPHAEHRVGRHKGGVDDVHRLVVFFVTESLKEIHLVVLGAGCVAADPHVIIRERVVVSCCVPLLVQLAPSDLRDAVIVAVVFF